tara:strand:+ start:512 stop:1900 length:1389 start_codon:yes stop_codon:yes gene_type:complete
MKPHSYAYDYAMIFCPRCGVWGPWTAPAYLLSAVRNAGFSAQYLDYNARLYAQNNSPELWTENRHHQYWINESLDHLINQIDIREIDAPVVGFSLTETNLRFSIELARKIKKNYPGKIILFGGHRVFYEEEPDNQVPLDACDAIVKGEGEITLIEILKNGLNGNPGTYVPNGNKWAFNGDRKLQKDLDLFPWPKYEDIDWDIYPARNIAIMGSRGCIYKCAFCNDVERAGYKFRKRSAESIAEEMTYHKEKNRVKYIAFNDPIINADFRHLGKLCDLMLQNNFNLPWGANFSIRKNMPKELICKAKNAGLRVVCLGLESGSSKVLKLMKKMFTVEEAEWFISALDEARIKVELNMVAGFPGETEKDFQDTIDFITKISPKVSRIVSVATLNLDHSYLWDHLNEYEMVKYDKDRHISWHTRDGQNTYAVRCKRAERLIRHSRSLGISHDRYDADIEKNPTVRT